MIGTARRVEGDLYNICERVKEVDAAYFIVRNYKTGKYELHAEGQRGGTLSLILPFDVLDERTVRLARKTRAERIKSLLAEAEAHNAQLLKSATEKAIQRMIATMEK